MEVIGVSNNKDYLIARLQYEISIAVARQMPNQTRKSGYIRGLEKAIEVVKITM